MRLTVMFAVSLFILCIIGYNSYKEAIVLKLPTTAVDPTWHGIAITFAILGILFGIYSASLMMEELRTKASRTAALTTPASPFEYWFAKWITHIVLFAAVYVLLFYLADCIRVLIFSLVYQEYNLNIAVLGKDIITQLTKENKSPLPLMLLSYLCIQSFYVLGSSFFPRHALLKTTIICFIGGALFLLGDALFVKEFMENGISINTGETFGRAILATITAFNWIVAYYRFKEVEIIDRL